MSNWLKNWRKGGPGSGPHPGHGTATPQKPSGEHSASSNNIQKPSSYAEQSSSRNPGKPRSGVRPSDLYPERGKPKKHWLGAFMKKR